MMLYRDNETSVTLWEPPGEKHVISMPEGVQQFQFARMDRQGRRVALLASEQLCTRWEEGIFQQGGIYIYDRISGTLSECYHGKTKEVLWDAAFSPDGETLYFSNGLDLMSVPVSGGTPLRLLRFQRIRSAPCGLDVSPDGRYLSYYRVRNNRYLRLYDRTTGEVTETKVNLSAYAWADEGRIAYCLYGGVKLLNVATLRSQSLVRDWRTVLKKGGAAARHLECLKREPADQIWNDTSLADAHDGRVWFYQSVRLPAGEDYPFVSNGLWSVAADGSDMRFHEDYLKQPVNCLILPDGERLNFDGLTYDGWKLIGTRPNR